jgi:hypothetical protein
MGLFPRATILVFVATALLLSPVSATREKKDDVQAFEENEGYWSRFVQEVANSLETPEPSSPPSPGPSPAPSSPPSPAPSPAPSPGPSPDPTIEPVCLVQVSPRERKSDNSRICPDPLIFKFLFLRSILSVSLSMAHPAKI